MNLLFKRYNRKIKQNPSRTPCACWPTCTLGMVPRCVRAEGCLLHAVRCEPAQDDTATIHTMLWNSTDAAVWEEQGNKHAVCIFPFFAFWCLLQHFLICCIQGRKYTNEVTDTDKHVYHIGRKIYQLVYPSNHLATGATLKKHTHSNMQECGNITRSPSNGPYSHVEAMKTINHVILPCLPGKSGI